MEKLDQMKNKIGLLGIGFVEFASQNNSYLESLFLKFGFSKIKKHKDKDINYYKQNDIHFFLNSEKSSKGDEFSQRHGPSISAMGWVFENPQKAYQLAIDRGAKAAVGDYKNIDNQAVLAIYGIGQSLIYFISQNEISSEFQTMGFEALKQPILMNSKGFTAIDHLTNNVENGTMTLWSDFYKNIFEFTDVRYFDIRGLQTGLTSYALKSPCETFCIPINEAKESKSQINEYLEEYNGPGIQHLAFLTEDILCSLDLLQNSEIQTLDIDSQYYEDIFKKFPHVAEDHEKIKKYNVLVDGDSEGYLLQIFTKNLIGPIFIEIIQRKNHYSFGEGNFGALFRSIERDQVKRGYLKS